MENPNGNFRSTRIRLRRGGTLRLPASSLWKVRAVESSASPNTSVRQQGSKRGRDGRRSYFTYVVDVASNSRSESHSIGSRGFSPPTGGGSYCTPKNHGSNGVGRNGNGGSSEGGLFASARFASRCCLRSLGSSPGMITC